MSRRNALGRRSKLAAVLSAVIVAVLLVPLPAFAAVVLADSYPEVYRQDELDVATWGPTGQTFLSGASGTLDSCQFMLRRVGPVAGDVYAQLWEHTGTFGTNGTPTGPALATSQPLDVSAVSDSWQTVTFAFDNSVALTSGTPYVITVDYPTGGTGALFVGLDWGGFMLHPGKGIYTWPAGTWNVG